jgi:DNA-binding MarR family transcriptional regulator
MKTSHTVQKIGKTAASAKPVPVQGRSTLSPDHQSLRLWLRLLACYNLVESHLRSQLRRQFGTTLARFDLMAQLDRHPQGLKMGDLSKLLMVTGGNVTGLVDRLTEEGLIQRRDDPSDRRAYFVRLTRKGQLLFNEITSMHEQWVISLFKGINRAQQNQLNVLLGKFREHLNTVSAP